METLHSAIDSSVNFVWKIDNGEALEARYVRRHEDYVACYLSTQTACAQACRMCHLTATGQNFPRDADFEQIAEQARTVIDYYHSQPRAKAVHFNFMARGEPLASKVLLEDSQELFLLLGEMAQESGLVPRFLISTIMPETLDKPLIELFPIVHPEIYYSLYSLRPEFRKRWLPRAMDPFEALSQLANWQAYTKKVVRIHHALIAGENDSVEDAGNIRAAVEGAFLRADYTLVRYNPPSEKAGVESINYKEYAEALAGDNWLGVGLPRVKVIDRVGPDVAASCGMFINP